MESFPDRFIKVCDKLRAYVRPQKTNLRKIRIGNARDGGYVVCEGLPAYDALYSYGSDDQITFEKEFHGLYGTDAYVYDHTIDGITDRPPYIRFFKEGVSESKTPFTDTIDSHVRRNGHAACENLFAQIDIEGFEWSVLDERCETIGSFSQVVVEFHLPLDPMTVLRMEHMFDAVFTFMNERFVCAHVHANNSPVQPWLDANFPRIFEVTYVRKDLATVTGPEDVAYPVPGLDFTCDPSRADLTLDYWLKVSP